MLVEDRKDEEQPATPFQAVRLTTRRGEVACRHYAVEATRKAALYVGGAGGGWDTPAGGLYPKLCEALQAEGIAGLRVRFRNPHVLGEAVHDVQAGLAYLQQKAIDHVALVGHSFGGAVVVQAAAMVPAVRTVVALATQSYGADPAARLGPRCSLLLLHGTADEILPARSSQYVFDLAGEPRQLMFFPGAGHVLDEVAEEIYRVTYGWITAQLALDEEA